MYKKLVVVAVVVVLVFGLGYLAGSHKTEGPNLGTDAEISDVGPTSTEEADHWRCDNSFKEEIARLKKDAKSRTLKRKRARELAKLAGPRTDDNFDITKDPIWEKIRDVYGIRHLDAWKARSHLVCQSYIADQENLLLCRDKVDRAYSEHKQRKWEEWTAFDEQYRRERIPCESKTQGREP